MPETPTPVVRERHPYPPEGEVLAVDTPAGKQLFRVTKASAIRTVLMPCDAQETARARAAQRAAVVARARAVIHRRFWAHLAVVAAIEVSQRRGLRKWRTPAAWRAQAAAILRGDG